MPNMAILVTFLVLFSFFTITIEHSTFLFKLLLAPHNFYFLGHLKTRCKNHAVSSKVNAALHELN